MSRSKDTWAFDDDEDEDLFGTSLPTQNFDPLVSTFVFCGEDDPAAVDAAKQQLSTLVSELEELLEDDTEGSPFESSQQQVSPLAEGVGTDDSLNHDQGHPQPTSDFKQRKFILTQKGESVTPTNNLAEDGESGSNIFESPFADQDDDVSDPTQEDGLEQIPYVSDDGPEPIDLDDYFVFARKRSFATTAPRKPPAPVKKPLPATPTHKQGRPIRTRPQLQQITHPKRALPPARPLSMQVKAQSTENITQSNTQELPAVRQKFPTAVASRGMPQKSSSLRIGTRPEKGTTRRVTAGAGAYLGANSGIVSAKSLPSRATNVPSGFSSAPPEVGRAPGDSSDEYNIQMAREAWQNGLINYKKKEEMEEDDQQGSKRSEDSKRVSTTTRYKRLTGFFRN